MISVDVFSALAESIGQVLSDLKAHLISGPLSGSARILAKLETEIVAKAGEAEESFFLSSAAANLRTDVAGMLTHEESRLYLAFAELIHELERETGGIGRFVRSQGLKVHAEFARAVNFHGGSVLSPDEITPAMPPVEPAPKAKKVAA